MPVDHAQLRVYDNGGITMDRYTVLRLDWVAGNFVECLGMSEQPDHPQGYGQHGRAQDGSHFGKRIAFSDLPERCQRVARHFTEN